MYVSQDIQWRCVFAIKSPNYDERKVNTPHIQQKRKITGYDAVSDKLLVALLYGTLRYIHKST